MPEEQKNDKISIHDKLVIDLRNSLTSRLDELVTGMLNSAQDRLFEMSNDADNNEDSARYFELMNQLRVLKTDVMVDFSSNFKKYLIPAAQFDLLHIQSHEQMEDELSLVDQDEMEGMVLVKSISGRAASRYQEQLSHLESRLEELGTRTEHAFRKDAPMPANICQAFNDALPDAISLPDKKLLFGMFEAHVTNKLQTLYEELNKRLIEAGILPQIKLGMSKNDSAPTRRSPPPPEAPDTGTIHPGQSDQPPQQGDDHPGGGAGNSGQNISGFAMTAAPGESYRHASAGPAASGGQTSSQGSDRDAGHTGEATGAPPASSAAPGDAGSGAAGAATRQGTNDDPAAGSNQFTHYTAGIPASQVGQVLNRFIGAPFTPDSTSKPAVQNQEFYQQSTPTHFGHQEIIEALSHVQNLPEFAESSELSFNGDAIKQAVMREIASASGGAVTKRINQIAEKTIDFIELIFDAIIDDDDISDAIKTLLLRLQIPIIKASMSDQEFFIYDSHPARVLLDRIAEVSVGVEKHTDNIYIKLDKIVNDILTDYELNTETFQKALDELNDYIDEQEAINRVKEEEEQQQLLRKHARATVLKSLRATTMGKILPEAVHPLILKRWPTLMFNHFLKHGKENNEWVNLVYTLRQIVEMVQPINDAEKLAHIIADKDTVFMIVEQYLGMSSSSKKDVRNVTGAFMATIQEHIDDANFSDDEVEQAGQTIEPVDKEKVLDTVREQEKVIAPEIPANISPGMWFQLYMGEGQAARRCKLSVIIVEDAKLMFVTHTGELISEKSFDEFSDEISSGKTKVIMGHSAFDYAFKSVIKQLD